MTTPVLGLRQFWKFVPTDMDWSGNFEGGYCRAYVSLIQGNSLYAAYVGIHGTGIQRSLWTLSLVRRFATVEEALAAYNRLTIIQSDADLADFAYGVDGEDNNGWPSPCPIAGPRWEDPVWVPGFGFTPATPRNWR